MQYMVTRYPPSYKFFIQYLVSWYGSTLLVATFICDLKTFTFRNVLKILVHLTKDSTTSRRASKTSR